MGVTVDVIPRLPGESPEAAIARIYDGGTRVVVDVVSLEVRVEEIVGDVDLAPTGVFGEWRAEVLRRLYELFPDWISTEQDGLPILWAPEGTTAVSLLDRLLHHAVVVATDGESYRMKQARTRGPRTTTATN